MTAYEIVEKRSTTFQRITAADRRTGRTVTFRWDNDALPTQYDLSCVFADADRNRIAQWKKRLGLP